jgi:hypothetical protein
MTEYEAVTPENDMETIRNAMARLATDGFKFGIRRDAARPMVVFAAVKKVEFNKNEIIQFEFLEDFWL